MGSLLKEMRNGGHTVVDTESKAGFDLDLDLGLGSGASIIGHVDERETHHCRVLLSYQQAKDSVPGTRIGRSRVYFERNDADGSARGFLKRQAMFMVEDSLIGRPVSPILGVSVLNQLSVPLNDIEVQVVNVGDQEGFRLSVASFVTDSALTSVLLR
ncbi:hypothetical protein L3X38_030866 [Prunus dulcis]|uniref:Uncharacterized protein n=1 Tax=Prunus dulcis TaxID=3755 RepID=A0AAD4VB30_PRUDU|nr:hypothetical protein L3X38_030866 [Prunus dulcis]